MKSLLLFGLSLFLMTTVSAVEFSSAVSPNTGTIGDEFLYTLTLTYDEGITDITLPSANVFSAFDLRDTFYEKTDDNGQIQVQYSVLFSVFKVGDMGVPAQTVVFHRGDQAYPKILSPVPFQVTSVLTYDAQGQVTLPGLSDIKDVPVDWMPYVLVWGGVLLALGALCLFGWWFWVKRRRPKAAFQGEEDLRSNEEIALDALALLQGQPLSTPSEMMAYYAQLSDILKTYFSAHFDMPLLECTSDECLAFLKGRLPEQDVRRVSNVLQLCDWVKFAKHTPSQSDHDAVLEKVIHVIKGARS